MQLVNGAKFFNITFLFLLFGSAVVAAVFATVVVRLIVYKDH